MRDGNGQCLRFGGFELDPANELLRKEGVVVKLPPQPFKVLALLASRSGQLVTREELCRAIWGDQLVDFEHGLNTCMRQIRTALGEQAGNPQFIETAPRLGYRFVAPMDLTAAAPPKLSLEAPSVAGRQIPPTGPTSSIVGGKGWLWWVVPLALTALFVAPVVMNVAGLRDRLRGRTGALQIQSLAVLPLENLSRDPEQEYFANGMTEALTTDLGKISTLRVISRTSAMTLKGTHKTLPEIGRELNADAVVEGAVLSSGNRVRITVQLIQAATDRHLWAGTYERPLQDVFAIQGEVAGSIANALRLELGAAPRRYTDDLEAYQLYLRGRYALDRRTPRGGSMRNAVQYFEQAAAKDSNYALAYAGSADTLLATDFQQMGPITSRQARDEAYQRAKAAAEKALELDATLSEAHTALAGVREREYEWQEAERILRRAIDLDPNNAAAHLELGIELLFIQGRNEDGLGEIRKALALDPLSYITHEYLAEALLVMGRYQEVVGQARKAIALDPTQVTGYMAAGRALYLQGRHAEAAAVLQEADRRSEGGHFPNAWLACAYVQAGQRDEAVRLLQKNVAQASGRGAQNRRWLLFHTCLGDKDAAFEYLEAMYAERDPVLPIWLAYPELAWMWPDPHFTALRQKLNVTR